MSSPRAVVIPFGVPSEGRGLGLGLAALVHGFALIDGQSVALAQLHPRKAEEPKPAPVEAFVPPHAWRDLAGAGNTPMDVTFVVTGSLEPPGDGRGVLQLLCFDAKDGKTRAKVEVALDAEHAGETLFTAFDSVWSSVGGELGALRDLRDLGWEALESVLRAERCALHDPARGGPHDRLAAMLHLGRAIGDAPSSRFPAGRLATIALEAAMASAPDAKLAEAALRALGRASDDAPEHLDVLEAMAALLIRLGKPREAERRLNAAVATQPKRARLYALLSEALRAQGSFDAALTVLDTGIQAIGTDSLLDTERGVVLAQRGDLVGAGALWRGVVAREPLHAAAFANLAALAVKTKDAATAQALVDQTLAAPTAPPELVRRAIHLALLSEADGLPRASRVHELAQRLVDAQPDDAQGLIVLARAAGQLGDKAEAIVRLRQVEQLAPGTALDAEAQRARFALEHPGDAIELEASLRAACSAPEEDLDGVSARARRLATLHGAWLAWVASAIAERRRARWIPAREAAEAALAIAPGCAAAHAELVRSHLALGNAASALGHAERAVHLEGDSPRTLGLLAHALSEAGRREDAEAILARALALDETDEANLLLRARLRAPAEASVGGKLKTAWAKLFG